MSFAVYKPLRQSTSIDHSVSGRFTTTHEEELIIARVNVIEVWRPPKLPERPSAEWVTSYELQGEVNSISLLNIDFDMFTEKEQEQWKLKLPEIGLDCLVLAFDEGKISLVAYDPLRPRTLRTIALFNFEETAKLTELKSSKVGALPVPKASFGARAHAFVDSKNRAIATIVYSAYLAVIPIRQILSTEDNAAKTELIRVLNGWEEDESSDTSGSDSDENGEAPDRSSEAVEKTDGGDRIDGNGEQVAESKINKHKSNHAEKLRRRAKTRGQILEASARLKKECGGDHPLFGTPHLLPLSRYGIPEHGALHACFAEGQSRPTVLILYSTPVRSWAARVAVYRHTCALAAIGLVPEDPLAATRLWSAVSLPHDSQCIVAIPSSSSAGGQDSKAEATAEGCIVVSTNSLTYVSSVPRDRYTMAVNGYASISCMATRAMPLYDMDGQKIDMANDGIQEYEDNVSTSERAALTLESSRWMRISSNLLLGSLSQGALLQVRLAGKKSGKGLRMYGKVLGALGGGVPFSCISRFSDILFFGSRSTDSLLVRYKEISFGAPGALALPEGFVMDDATDGNNPSSITSIAVTSAASLLSGDEDLTKKRVKIDLDGVIEDEEEFLYRGESTLRGEDDEANVALSLEVVDVIPVYGPITDMDFADAIPTVPYKENADDEEKRKLESAQKQAEEYRAKKYFSEAAKILERAKLEVEEDRKRRAMDAVKRDVDLITCGTRNRLGSSVTMFQSGLRQMMRSEIPVSECAQLFDVGDGVLVMSESSRTRVFLQRDEGSSVMETMDHPLFSASRPTLLASRFVSNASWVQVFPDEILFFASPLSTSLSIMLFEEHQEEVMMQGEGGPTTPVIAPSVGIAQCSAVVEHGLLFLLMSDARVRMFRADSTSLQEVSMDNVPFKDNIAAISAFTTGSGVVNVCTVRAGMGEKPDHGILEVFEVGSVSSTTDETTVDVRTTFRSQSPLALCVPSLVNSLHMTMLSIEKARKEDDLKETSARIGVLTNSKVVDFAVARIGDGRVSRTVLAAALGDGDLVVYCKTKDSDSSWSKMEHRTITRGLRGRAARKRKYAQPAGPLGRWFRGPVLIKISFPIQASQTSVSSAGVGAASTQGLFFAGHRPSFILCNRGQVSVVPLASSVGCPLPPALVPSAEDTPGLDSFVPSQSSQAQQQQNQTLKRRGIVPDASDVYKVRGAIHALCQFNDGFVYALKAPDMATKPSSMGMYQQQQHQQQQQSAGKTTALRFCTLPMLFQNQQMDDLSNGIVARVHRLFKDNWAVTRILYLPHASRGSNEELPLNLHVPTLAIVSTRNETLRSSKSAAADDSNEDSDLALQQMRDRDVPEHEPDPRLGGAPDVTVSRHFLELIRAPDYGKVVSSLSLAQDERVICMITATLNAPLDNSTTAVASATSKPERNQLPGLIVLGTGMIDPRGEEAQSRGRILVFQVDNLPDPALSREEAERMVKVLGRPATKPSLRQIASVELRGPISALATLEGKILAATGNLPCQLKLLELSSRNEGLIPVGFYDAPTCAVTLNVIKDQYVLLGDMNKSLQFLRWKDRQFQLLGRSFESVRVYSSEFALDGNRLLLCVGDDESNLRVWHFDPDSQVLQPRAEINIGTRVGKMRAKRVNAIPVKTEEVSAGSTYYSSAGGGGDDSGGSDAMAMNKWAIAMGTLAGGLAAVLPLDERSFRRLDLLQQAMTQNALLVPRNAGLHPAQSAIPRVPKRPGKLMKTKTIVDGRIVFRFVDLEKIAQRKLAMSIGSTVDTILDTLLEIELLTNW